LGEWGDDGRPLVTKTSFRFLQTLYNLGPAPEPNLTIWYSSRLPEGFRRFTSRVAIDTSAIQFENDEIMRRTWGDDGAIACCVSPMLVGKQMQFFGARANMAKCLLYTINGGRDEVSGVQVSPPFEPVQGEFLEFDEVLERFEKMMEWLARVYVNAMNVIHYMHDKYSYERIEMALHDYSPLRTMAFGMAGLSVVADSLSAIRYARVRVVRDPSGLAIDYQIEGEYPQFGNNDNRVDQLATWVVSTFMKKLRQYPTYRNAIHTQSILTITSNVVYGKATGNTPDGRRKGEPFAPGANPMYGREKHGIHASAASVAKIPYRDAADGISLTSTIVPQALGRVAGDRIDNLTNMLDAFFSSTGYHMNVNVLNRDTLKDAMDHPEKYPHLTIRVSGYAVNFVRLTREQQMDVLSRAFHSF
jgi:formate C-acetyltransferase